MSFLKTTFQSPQYNALQGFSNNPFHRLELIEDNNGDYFIHEGIKNSPQYSAMLHHFNAMEEVETIDFKQDIP